MDKQPKDGPAVTPLSGLNKRQQVTRAANMIFVWVAVASAVVALCAVLLQFMVKQALFNQKIINEKSATNKIVTNNIENASQLKQNVDKLIADQNLASIRANESDHNLQVVLDALPTNGDTTSLSNSLYTRILGPTGIKIDNVTAGVIDGAVVTEAAASGVTSTTPAAPGDAPSPQSLPFMFTTTGSVAQTKAVFINLEKTIRPINPQVVSIRVAEGGVLTTTIGGETYYLPASTVDLGKKQVKP